MDAVVDRPALRTRAEMREAVLFDGPDASQKRSRYWMLLILAAIIAAGGVVIESEATVIGAMLVAPLRTPILGTMLAVVLGDRANLLRSIGLVIAGAAVTIAVGYVMGLFMVLDVTARNNSEVASYSSAGVIDLIIALAVGAVGSIALARRDIADALPGVAIAISLVPPLVVTGITIESGAGDDALGAILLFLTNVASILAVGVVTMAIFHIRGRSDGYDQTGRPVNQREAYWVIGLLVMVVAALLVRGSWRATADTITGYDIDEVVTAWAEPADWEVVGIEPREGGVTVRLEGALPTPDIAELRESLLEAELDPDTIVLDLLPRERVDLSDPDGSGAADDADGG